MTAYLRPRSGDPAEPGTPPNVQVTVDGHPVTALAGQTVAAVLLTQGRNSWRTTRHTASPRGVFCGIGTCHDCLVVVNGTPDTRACQRTIQDADTITTQVGAVLPHPPTTPQPHNPADPAPRNATDAELDNPTDAELGNPTDAELGNPTDAELRKPTDRAQGETAGPEPLEPVAPLNATASSPHADASAQHTSPARHLASTPPPKAADVVVVGAGPAGVAAALAAADEGASVVLIDSGRAVGGQFNRQLPVEFAPRRPERLQHGWKDFAAQRDRVATHNRITQLSESSVWAIEGLRLWVQRGPADGVGRDVFPVNAKAVVLATGAYDRVLPFPGWDLPGVYSAGAAQALAKGQRISVGRRVIVAGTGPFLLPVAGSLTGVGACVVALLEANSLQTVRKGWSTDPLVASSKLREALGYGALLARHRIPLRHGWTVTAAHGTDHVEAVTIARLDDDWHPIPASERRIEVDAVCLGFGFTAQLELAVSARCDLTTGPDGGPAVVVNADQQTTTPGIFAAGELTGIGGAALSTAEGRVAGAAAAQHARSPRPNPELPVSPASTAPPATGRTRAARDPGVRSASDDGARAAVVKGRRFAAALAKAYPVREGWRDWSRADTLVCRCEEVSRGEIEEAVADRGVGDGRGLRLSSRAGLGLCQGRVCSRTVAELVAGQNDVPRPSMKRPIAVPVRLRDLAEAQEEL
ncbi:FAD-dependent oxidoreductase [Kribbella sp. NPDC026596]|uniref:FAD-dependent oxidoreductase n=1 Tax=Kribbella sp. NPDC026596 TaxID=3155122 RepID=UPI00340C1BED